MRYPCPCCGRLVHDEAPGSYAICPVCLWEDDPVQLCWPMLAGGANRPSLVEAQHTFAQHGASTLERIERVRPAFADEPVEAGFRPADPDVDDLEPNDILHAPWPDDLTVKYWWRNRGHSAHPQRGVEP